MFQISGQTALDFLWLGKEATMSPDWIHYSRALHEYELMIIDEGVLYIADEFGKYTVSKGEYILMAPCRHQYGWKPSCCAFHWLHFRLPDISCPSETARSQCKQKYQIFTRFRHFCLRFITMNKLVLI